MNIKLGNCELVNLEFVFLFFLNRKGRKGLRKGRKGKADYELYVMSYKLIGNENQQPTTNNQQPTTKNQQPKTLSTLHLFSTISFVFSKLLINIF